ncbi:MAG: hypothetical protein ACYC9K_06435 [Sulfuricaulis sp.]
MTIKRVLMTMFALALIALAEVFWFHAMRSGGAMDGDDEDDKPVVVPERVSTIDGQRVITLDALTQKQNNIVTAHPAAARAPRHAAIATQVLDSSALSDLYRRYARARRNAPALAAALRRSAAQGYGAALAAALTRPTSAFAEIFRGKSALLEITVPAGGTAPRTLPARDIRGRRLTLSRLAPAAQPEHWFYRAATSAGLAPGDTVSIFLSGAAAAAGVTVPAAAIVWHDGVPWVYVRRDGRRFTRLNLARAVPRADAGYWTAALTPNDEIVVQGAQLLMSEEFRARIQSEG